MIVENSESKKEQKFLNYVKNYKAPAQILRYLYLLDLN